MYETGNIIKRVPPIHHVVDVKLPVANITVTKESDTTRQSSYRKPLVL